MKEVIISIKRNQVLALSAILVFFASCSHQNHVVSKGIFQKRKYTKGWFVKQQAFQQAEGKVDANKNSIKRIKSIGLQVSKIDQSKSKVVPNTILKDTSVVKPEEFQENGKVLSAIDQRSTTKSTLKSTRNLQELNSSHSSMGVDPHFTQTKKTKEHKQPKETSDSKRTALWTTILIVLIVLLLPNVFFGFVFVYLESVALQMIIGIVAMFVISFAITHFWLNERSLSVQFLTLNGIVSIIAIGLLLMLEFLPIYPSLLGLILLISPFFLSMVLSIYYLIYGLIIYNIHAR